MFRYKLIILMLISTISYGQRPMSRLLFKSAPSVPAVTWNPSAKGANVTLSNSNLSQDNVAGAGSVRATKAVAVGLKVAWEIYLDNIGGNPTIGIDDGSGNLTSYTGSDSHGWGFYYPFTQVYHSGSPTSTNIGASTGQVITVAVDLVSNTVTFYVNGATVTPSFSISHVPYYPAAGAATSGTNKCTARFLSSSFTQTILWATLQAAGYVQLP